MRPRLFDGHTAWIDYDGPPGTIKTVSLSRVEQGKTPRGLFRNKVVVVGPSAPSLQDVHPTSTTGNELMSGAEIQANAIETVRRGLPLEPASGALNLVLIVMLGLAAPLASLRLSPLRAIALALAAGGVFAVGVQLAFNHGTIVSFVYPIGALLLAAFGALARALRDDRGRARARARHVLALRARGRRGRGARAHGRRGCGSAASSGTER